MPAPMPTPAPSPTTPARPPQDEQAIRETVMDMLQQVKRIADRAGLSLSELVAELDAPPTQRMPPPPPMV